MELYAAEEPLYTYYMIPESVDVRSELLPTITQADTVTLEYDEETKKHTCIIRNSEKGFEQTLKLKQKETNYLRRLLNEIPEIDTSEEGNIVYPHY